MSPATSSFLNLCRWVAAWLVVVDHVRHLLLPGLDALAQAPQGLRLLYRAVYFVTGFGHEAVVVFFVISGYLVGGLTWQRWQSHGVDLRRYALARFSRIYTVLLPALLVGGAMDALGWRWFDGHGLYSDHFHIEHALTLPNGLGSALMVQRIWTDDFGTNSPLWSLAYEWWYYVAFAVFAAAALTPAPKRWLWAAGGVALLWVLPVDMVLWGSLWLLGLLTQRWMARPDTWRPSPRWGLLALLLGLLVARLSHTVDNLVHPEPLWQRFGRDALLAVAFVIGLASTARRSGPLRWAHGHQRLADFSYSTYLCHYPAMVLAAAALSHWRAVPLPLPPALGSLGMLLALIVSVLAFCWAFAALTERHTAAVQAVLSRLTAPRRQIGRP